MRATAHIGMANLSPFLLDPLLGQTAVESTFMLAIIEMQYNNNYVFTPNNIMLENLN